MTSERSANWPRVSRSLNCILANFIIVFLVACGGTDNSNLYNAEVPVSTQLGAGSRSSNLPTNPNADRGAIQLLHYLNEISGKQVLSGQGQLFWDNEFSPHFPSVREQYVYDQIGKYPAIYTTDFGSFHHDDDPDIRAAILARRGGVVDAAIEHAQSGSIIAMHYNMVEPTEPDGTGIRNYKDGVYNPDNIAQMLSNGSPLNEAYEQRLDEIAGYLARLRDEGIPVLWRPFHKMNGPWFWWGQQARFEELWQHQWRYFTEVHGLTNLVWVFSVSHWPLGRGPEWDPASYYPGHQYVDVLSADVILENGHKFDQHVYDALLQLGDQRPVGITESGQMPDLATLRKTQPMWVFWSTRSGDESSSSQNLYRDNYVILDEYVITQDETSFNQ